MRAEPRDKLVADTAAALKALRSNRPRVHCLTNTVAMAYTANMLLAVGAVPSMTIAVDEVPDFVTKADALLVNLGTFDAGRRRAMELAVEVATERQTPWVLDPVFVDRSPVRTAFAAALAARAPDAIRANTAELGAIAGRDVDENALSHLALERLTTIALTGETDLVTDGARLITVSNGHPLMACVTAVGCAESAVLAALLAVEEDPLVAAAAALLTIGVAGEVAAAHARGPGTFAPALIDAVYAMDEATLARRAQVT